MESPSLLLFDLDGTLVDTAPEMHSALNILLKEQGMTISGVKKLLNSKKSLKLDEFSNNSISVDNIKIKNKLKNISNLIKQIKKLK